MRASTAKSCSMPAAAALNGFCDSVAFASRAAQLKLKGTRIEVPGQTTEHQVIRVGDFSRDMKTRAVFTFIILLAISTSPVSADAASGTGRTDTVAELTGSYATVTAQDNARHSTTAPFEPLLLLLLGSTLFSIGTVIKLVLSRQLRSKPAHEKTIANRRFVGPEPLQGGD